MRGQVIAPANAAYEEARKVWNGTIDKKPGVIVRCATADDIIAAVNFGRTQGVTVSVRRGGHNVAGGALNDGGIVIVSRPSTAQTTSA